jgi:hypothetical protein
MESSVVSRSPEAATLGMGGAQEDVLSDLDLPVNFGDVLQLLGYDLRTPTVAPGGTVELVTLWQVTNPDLFQAEDLADLGNEPVLFIHALDTTGTLIAQEDRLDAPAWDWQKGDVIAQSHRVVLPRDVHDRLVNLEAGVYRQVDLARLPVLADDQVIGDCVFFSPVEIKE